MNWNEIGPLTLQHQNKDETVGWMLRHFHICEYYGLSLKPNHGVGFT